MEHMYKFSKASPPRWKRLWRLMLVILLLVPSWQAAKAVDYYINSTNVNMKATFTSLANDGYIDIDLPVYESSGDHEGLLSGSRLSASIGENKNSVDLIFFKTLDGEMTGSSGEQSLDNDHVWIKAYTNKGFTQIKDLAGNYTNLSGTELPYYLGIESITGGFKVSTAHFRWYIPSEYAGESITLTLNLRVDYAGDGKGAIAVTKELGTGTGGTYPTPSLYYSFSTDPGKYQVTYSATGITPKAGSTIKWNSESETSSTTTTGSRDFNVSDNAQNVSFTYTYKISDYATCAKTAQITLLPFRQAINFAAADSANGDTKLTWNIADNASNDYQASTFEVERSTDSGFSTTSTITVGEVAFDKTTLSYSMIDKTGAENLNKTIYYRIRRKAASTWGWKFCQEKSITKAMHHRGIQSATAKMTADNSSVEVSWTLEPVSSNSVVWTTGAKVYIVRTDLSSSNKVENFAINDTTVKSYIDKNLTFCHSYDYAVMVRPGTDNYKDTEAVKAKADKVLQPSVLAQITSVTASKGYYPTFTRVQWTTDGKPTESFVVERRLVNGSDTIFQKVGSTEANVTYYDDKEGSAGVVYEYRIKSFSNCNNNINENISPMTDRGFRSPTGTISGLITFSYGDAVANVDVRVNSASDVNTGSILTSYSYLFKDADNSYLETDSTINIPEFATIQMLSNRQKKIQALFSNGAVTY